EAPAPPGRRPPPRPNEQASPTGELAHAAQQDQRPVPRKPGRHHRQIAFRREEVRETRDDEGDAGAGARPVPPGGEAERARNRRRCDRERAEDEQPEERHADSLPCTEKEEIWAKRTNRRSAPQLR